MKGVSAIKVPTAIVAIYSWNHLCIARKFLLRTAKHLAVQNAALKQAVAPFCSGALACARQGRLHNTHLSSQPPISNGSHNPNWNSLAVCQLMSKIFFSLKPKQHLETKTHVIQRQHKVLDSWERSNIMRANGASFYGWQHQIQVCGIIQKYTPSRNVRPIKRYLGRKVEMRELNLSRQPQRAASWAFLDLGRCLWQPALRIHTCQQDQKTCWSEDCWVSVSRTVNTTNRNYSICFFPKFSVARGQHRDSGTCLISLLSDLALAHDSGCGRRAIANAEHPEIFLANCKSFNFLNSAKFCLGNFNYDLLQTFEIWAACFTVDQPGGTSSWPSRLYASKMLLRETSGQTVEKSRKMTTNDNQQRPKRTNKDQTHNDQERPTTTNKDQKQPTRSNKDQ